MNIGVVLAGGSGQRFGSDVPKQYTMLNGKEVIAYSITALMSSDRIDKVIVMCAASEKERLAKLYSVETVEGGPTRNSTIKKALAHIEQSYDCNNIIILEAARPMVTNVIVDSYIDLLENYDAVITAQIITDSLGSKHHHIVDRSDYYLIQAPEAFKFSLLNKYFDEKSSITATNQQLPPNAKLYVNYEFRENLKITHREDLAICANLMKGK